MLQTEKEMGNLVLNRSAGSSVKIGDDIVITYLGQDDNDTARLRISAPTDINISRVRLVNNVLLKQ